MGMHGPLTAQALGRSPYDPEPLEGESSTGSGEEDNGSYVQKYDARGRPINPETKRRNRDLIRAHNEVMLAVGVAEAENPQSAAENEGSRQHDAYETNIGIRLIWASKRCIEMAGVFGINGLRQRILVYKEFSHSPCYDLFKFKTKDFSFQRDVLAGAPSALLAGYIQRRFLPPYVLRILWKQDSSLIHRCAYAAWSYFKLHLELYAAFQRLGLISATSIFPSWHFFLPFGDNSLITKPPPPLEFTPQSILHWIGGVCVSAAPFLIWAMTQSLIRGWRAGFWDMILLKLPNPIVHGRPIPVPPEPEVLEEEVEVVSRVVETHSDHVVEVEIDIPPEWDMPAVEAETNSLEGNGSAAPPSSPEERTTSPPENPEHNQRQSEPLAPGADDFGSDDEEDDFLSSNIFRFEIEATEATGPDPPSGLWSAELRPSAEPGDGIAGPPPAYLSTMLTRLPSITAAAIFADSCVRLVAAPYEAVALRLAARSFCAQHGLSTAGMFSLRMFEGVNMTWAVNFLGTELSYLVVSGEIWSMTTLLSSWLHKSEEEWKDFEGKDWGDWLGVFRSNEPLY